jgi:hypothetical protein
VGRSQGSKRHKEEHCVEGFGWDGKEICTELQCDRIHVLMRLLDWHLPCICSGDLSLIATLDHWQWFVHDSRVGRNLKRARPLTLLYEFSRCRWAGQLLVRWGATGALPETSARVGFGQCWRAASGFSVCCNVALKRLWRSCQFCRACRCCLNWLKTRERHWCKHNRPWQRCSAAAIQASKLLGEWLSWTPPIQYR